MVINSGFPTVNVGSDRNSDCLSIYLIYGVLSFVQPAQQAFLYGLGEKNEERESKTARKVAQVKERGGGGEERKVSFLPLPLPPFLLFGSRFISRAVKTESPLPRYFFAPKPNGNACYAGYLLSGNTILFLLFIAFY